MDMVNKEMEQKDKKIKELINNLDKYKTDN